MPSVRDSPVQSGFPSFVPCHATGGFASSSKKVRRRSDGCALRKRMSRCVKANSSALRLEERPVHPGGLVVLAVGVVVAALRAAELVPGEQHGDALREEEEGQEVALLPPPKRVHLRARRGPLLAAVPGEVVVVAVGVALAVLPVVLVVVGDEVGEGEAVVAGQEVDRVPGRAVRAPVEVGAAGEPRREQPASSPGRSSRSGAPRRGSARSTRPSGPSSGSCPPGRARPRPTPRR